jgi:hypothetical protein
MQRNIASSPAKVKQYLGPKTSPSHYIRAFRPDPLRRQDLSTSKKIKQIRHLQTPTQPSSKQNKGHPFII